MYLSLKAKLLIAIGTAFLLSFGVVTYLDYQNSRAEIITNLSNEARTIRGMMKATRKVYRHQFIASGVPLNDKTVGFLPAHALNRISDEFKHWVKSGLSFNNVSDRPRNSKQAADAAEMEAINFFRATEDVNERIIYYRNEKGAAFYHFAWPMWITKDCMKCHGKREDAPESIRDMYKGAFGYEVGDLRGILSIKMPAALLEKRLAEHLWRSLATYLMGFVLTFVAVFWLLKKTILNRLDELTVATSQVASGNYHARIGHSGSDEISRVSSAFDSMAEAVEHRERSLSDSEKRSRAIYHAAGEGIIVADAKGVIHDLNPAVIEIFGYEEPELLGGSLAILLPKDKRLAHLKELLSFVYDNKERVVEHRRIEVSGQRKNGEIFPLELNLNTMQLEKQRYFLGVVEDISERKKAEKEIRSNQAFLQTIIDGVVDPIMVIGTDYKISMTNSVASKNISESLLVDGPGYCYQVSHGIDQPCDGEEHPCPLRQVIDTEKPVTVVHQHLVGEGERRTFELDASPLWGEDGQLKGIIEVSRDVTDRLEVERKLIDNEERMRYQANHDTLTGLPNRALFNDRLEHAINRVDREHGRLAVLFLDLDRFKNINDTLGHDIGDGMLKQIARRLERGVREEDTVARMGGDEFIIILEDAHSTDNIILVVRKCLRILSKKMSVRGIELFPSVSIGVSIYPDDARTVEDLMKCADTAMYRAKDAGCNTFQFYTTDMNTQSYRRLILEAGLRRAIDDQQLILHYQPQFELRTGNLLGAEALVRWNHPEHGMIAPGEFIPLAEDVGLIEPIGEWVLSSACQQLRHWHDQGLPQIKMAVNVSARQFNSHLPDVVADILNRVGLPATSLELEITESVLMGNVEATASVLKELEQMGITLAIDDFGTGYSSLSYLKRFPISTLKVDRSFVSDVPDDDDCAIVSSVVALASNLGLDVVAEGVETGVQMEYLKQIGCGQVQGFLFGRPVPAEEFVAKHL